MIHRGTQEKGVGFTQGPLFWSGLEREKREDGWPERERQEGGYNRQPECAGWIQVGFGFRKTFVCVLVVSWSVVVEWSVGERRGGCRREERKGS